jgi:hypothetical protein
MSNSDRHDNYTEPNILVGGGARKMKLGGQHIVLPERTPIANLHLTLLQKIGVEREKIRRQHRHNRGCVNRMPQTRQAFGSGLLGNRCRDADFAGLICPTTCLCSSGRHPCKSVVKRKQNSPDAPARQPKTGSKATKTVTRQRSKSSFARVNSNASRPRPSLPHFTDAVIALCPARLR